MKSGVSTASFRVPAMFRPVCCFDVWLDQDLPLDL